MDILEFTLTVKSLGKHVIEYFTTTKREYYNEVGICFWPPWLCMNRKFFGKHILLFLPPKKRDFMASGSS